LTALLKFPQAVNAWLPEISVEQTKPAVFAITNDKEYRLEELSVEASLRCAWIGQGDVPPPADKRRPSMHSQPQRWTQQSLEPHLAYEINPGEVLFATPGALRYGQLDFFVSFQPWKIPYRVTRAFRFETRKLADGSIQWMHIPSD
jgi:hypothetical protein